MTGRLLSQLVGRCRMQARLLQQHGISNSIRCSISSSSSNSSKSSSNGSSVGTCSRNSSRNSVRNSHSGVRSSVAINGMSKQLLCHRWTSNTIGRTLSQVILVRCQSSRIAGRNIPFDGFLEQHLVDIKQRHKQLADQLAEASSNQDIARLGKESARLSHIVEFIDERVATLMCINELIALEKDENGKGADGEEMAMLARVEIEENSEKLVDLEARIVRALTPRDEADDRGVVLEVRAGTGGDEASLFAGELFKMYQKYASLMGWQWEEMSLSRSEIGGFKEAQASITGEAVYKMMKFESGVHRVQRVPVNDVRIQTSAASVVVLPEAEELDVELRAQDLRIDVFRAGGAGGQSVNRTESAVRITHLPTGCVVSMQDERSQIQNRARAMKYLRARVYDLERRKKDQARQELRSAAQGTGDRADKIRTYNFPQDRVTDHRVGETVTGVGRVMNGESGMSQILNALLESDERERLEEFLEEITKRDRLR